MSADIIARGLASKARTAIANGDLPYARTGTYGGTTIGRKLQETVSVRDFGAKGDGITDDTAALQAAFSAAAAGTVGHLFLPDGTYKITSAITLNQANIIGMRVIGSSRDKAIIKQFTANVAVFDFTFDMAFGNVMRDFQMTWNTAQTGNTGAAAFRFRWKTGTGIHDFFSNYLERLRITNCYWVVYSASTDISIWGNKFDFHVQTVGGVMTMSAAIGQPKNTIEGYYNGGAAGEVMFRCNASTNEYFVEINGSSALMLYDGGGGTHLVRHWAMEGQTLAVSGNMFDLPNSRLISYGSMYLEGSNVVQAAATTVYMFRVSGAGAALDVRLFSFAFNSQGAGAKWFLFNGGTLDQPARIRTIRGTFSTYGTAPVRALTDTAAAAGATVLAVDDWLDPLRITRAGDANVDLSAGADAAYRSPPTIVYGGAALTADRVVKLPPHNGVSDGCSLFDGRYFEVVKFAAAGTTFKIDIQNYLGVVVATIPAATAQGRIRVQWHRSSLTGGASIGNWSVLPVQL
ncbi:glycoside hydrolase family 55 protein [Novosphingobium sp. KCTC 2891]|uniref:glycoside hydrolase family 55 protein n=1 Tax=Novosphingobium sp. KCTC 2891 TaxID=2989730 RepID=UPI0022224931|nr:glycoside hydrolase family 55 protein [Novosphingobium sp. KCTC 2891]MCW1383266.1 glycoside hydrolase family 55 protein [Novosphingobium sp. KCTC 2891]